MKERNSKNQTLTLTPELLEKICALLEQGKTPTEIARECGINRSLLYIWRSPLAQKRRNPIYREYAQRYEQIMADRYVREMESLIPRLPLALAEEVAVGAREAFDELYNLQMHLRQVKDDIARLRKQQAKLEGTQLMLLRHELRIAELQFKIAAYRIDKIVGNAPLRMEHAGAGGGPIKLELTKDELKDLARAVLEDCDG